MMRPWILLFVFASSTSIAQIPSYENCHFYLDMEKKRGCWFHRDDDSDYLVKYGYKFCSVFKAAGGDWDDERTLWVKKTAVCLQEAVLQHEKTNTCRVLEDYAFDSHPGCYQKGGFCSLTKWQKTTVVYTAFGIDILLKPKKSFRQAFRLLKHCSFDVADANATAVYGRLMLGSKHFTEAQSQKAADIFFIGKMSEDNSIRYFRTALDLLMTDVGNRSLPRSTIDNFVLVFKPDGRATADVESAERCLYGDDQSDFNCRNLKKRLGSQKQIATLRSIPLEVRPDQLDQILKQKRKFLAIKTN